MRLSDLNPIPVLKDPRRRPRLIMWSGIAIIAFVVIWAAALDGTSTYWFCTEPCHIVHEDNTIAYQASTHTNVSCIACHEPVDADPLTLTILKIEVAPDAIETIFKTFHLPMNAHNYVALKMPTEQCTQCHNMENRIFTPSEGIFIDHKIHAEKDVKCTLCHNRVAHPEESIKLVLEGDEKHDNWMTMDGCFRCHSQEKTEKETPPGACEACHPANYDLLPDSHEKDGWYELFGESGMHAAAASEESSTVAQALAFAAQAEKPKAHGAEETADLKPSSAVNSCYTCHKQTYCSNCHGLDMPHPQTLIENHIDEAFSQGEVCGRCHARNPQEAKGTGFCNACHHPESTEGRDWVVEHAGVVKDSEKKGEPCFECHQEEQCAYCHVNGTARFREQGTAMWEE